MKSLEKRIFGENDDSKDAKSVLVRLEELESGGGTAALGTKLEEVEKGKGELEQQLKGLEDRIFGRENQEEKSVLVRVEELESGSGGQEVDTLGTKLGEGEKGKGGLEQQLKGLEDRIFGRENQEEKSVVVRVEELESASGGEAATRVYVDEKDTIWRQYVDDVVAIAKGESNDIDANLRQYVDDKVMALAS